MMNEQTHTLRSRLGARRLAVLAIAATVGACNTPSSGTPVGSNTNWLVSCSDSVDCGGAAACVCGACSRECGSDADCGALPDARCVTTEEAAVRSQCRSDAPELALGMCLARCEPGSCAPAQACVEGACVVAVPPDSDLCATASAPDASARQDRLVSLLEQLRSAGGVVCGTAASVPVPPLRWDPRLACEARSLAADMAATRSQSLIDSAGRDTVARLGLVGYSQKIWGEAFALVPGTEDMALAAMLSDVDSCGRFVSAAFTEVGVGNVDDAYVITVANE